MYFIRELHRAQTPRVAKQIEYARQKPTMRQRVRSSEVGHNRSRAPRPLSTSHKSLRLQHGLMYVLFMFDDMLYVVGVWKCTQFVNGHHKQKCNERAHRLMLMLHKMCWRDEYMLNMLRGCELRIQCHAIEHLLRATCNKWIDGHKWTRFWMVNGFAFEKDATA